MSWVASSKEAQVKAASNKDKEWATKTNQPLPPEPKSTLRLHNHHNCKWVSHKKRLTHFCLIYFVSQQHQRLHLTLNTYDSTLI